MILTLTKEFTNFEHTYPICSLGEDDQEGEYDFTVYSKTPRLSQETSYTYDNHMARRITAKDESDESDEVDEADEADEAETVAEQEQTREQQDQQVQQKQDQDDEDDDGADEVAFLLKFPNILSSNDDAEFFKDETDYVEEIGESYESIQNGQRFGDDSSFEEMKYKIIKQPFQCFDASNGVEEMPFFQTVKCLSAVPAL